MSEKKTGTRRKRTDYSKAAVAGERTTTVEQPVRTTPIRTTIDIKPTVHTMVKRWCNMTAADMGLSDVHLAEVTRVLWHLLVDPTNQDLAERVRVELTRGSGKLT